MAYWGLCWGHTFWKSTLCISTHSRHVAIHRQPFAACTCARTTTNRCKGELRTSVAFRVQKNLEALKQRNRGTIQRRNERRKMHLATQSAAWLLQGYLEGKYSSISTSFSAQFKHYSCHKHLFAVKKLFQLMC